MSADDLNAFVYAMHYQVEAMSGWAQTVNDAVTDHAVRIDVLHGEGSALTSMVSDALGKCGQGEHDTRQVMALVQANDDVLRAQDAVTKVRIEEVMTLIGAEVLKLTTSQAGAYTELFELVLSSGNELTRTVDGKLNEHTLTVDGKTKNIEIEFLKLVATVGAPSS